MSDQPQFCPRAVENGGGPGSPFKPPLNGEMKWREDHTCSYCGSLNPDEFMRRLEARDVTLVPTDKSYKVYVEGPGFTQTFRDCPRDAICKGPEECTHWATRAVGGTKFYFQHLSPEQQVRFIELYNSRCLRIGVPGYFYQLPFFCRRVEPPRQDDGA